jgi:putative membrane protein (TIGR04086 family)
MDKVIHENTKIFTLLKGLLFSYIVTAFVLLLLSFMMLKFDLPGAAVSGGIILAYIASSFIGGFFVGKKIEQRKFLWGLVMGVFYFIILLLVSLMMNRVSPLPVGNLTTSFIICSISGMLGGMLS